jgi:hypothetical protein
MSPKRHPPKLMQSSQDKIKSKSTHEAMIILVTGANLKHTASTWSSSMNFTLNLAHNSSSN